MKTLPVFQIVSPFLTAPPALIPSIQSAFWRTGARSASFDRREITRASAMPMGGSFQHFSCT